MTVTNDNALPTDAINGFTYHIRSAPALTLPVDWLTMFGDARDMERGVLHLISAAHARYSYLPVQAVPQGMITPDLIVDVADGGQILTTLHFCTVWRGMQRDRHPETWERVSFPKRTLALLYNDIRLHLCRACHHLHKYTCLLDEQQTCTSLTQAVQPCASLAGAGGFRCEMP